MLAVALVAGAVAGTAALLKDEDSGAPAARPTAKAVVGSDAAPFRLVFPEHWRVVDQATTDWDGRSPVLSLRRDDSSGTVALRVGGRLQDSLARVRSELRSELPRRAEARRLSSRRITLDGGNALLTLWVDGGSGNVQSNVVVPAGDVSYVLDAAVASGADVTAREVGDIIGSFQKAPL